MTIRPSQVKDIFNQVLELEAAVDRSAYLDQACAGDEELRGKVQSLLNAYGDAGSFLDAPHPALAATVCPKGIPSPQPDSEAAGAVIGRYKLLQPIGEGGMGAVWMAEQVEPVRRTVALKIIKAGMESSQIIARFDAERQALAMMDHPNIAKVLDAGTTASGRPYFVMELVKGVPINQYCDRQRLTVRERLALFASVCQALQHAHQKGIIHRDIKPSNVLVAPYDGRPVVKVIDFGVAKATGQRLTEQTMYTEFGAVIGTLQYMSPEQAELNNQDIDTRSDIYSLGVLLYELLTGTTPLDVNRLRSAAFAALLMAIQEEQPPTPSTRLSESKDSLHAISAQRQIEPAKLPKLLRGELDWIVMKALEKDRTRRYETANGLAQDIERYLADEPVQARPPSAGYRLRKFVKRNRGLAVATAAVLLVLLAGVVGTTLGMLQAWRQQQLTEHARSQEARQRAAAVASENLAKEEAAKAQASRQQAEILAIKEREARQQSDKDKAAARFQALCAGHARHAAQLHLALLAWQHDDLWEAERVLDEVDASFQSTWEQRFLRGVCRRKALPLAAHDEHVQCAAITPDGTRAVTGSGAMVRVWDSVTGQLKFTFKEHTARVLSVAISPDGTRVVSMAADTEGKLKDVQVWDTATGETRFTLAGHAGQVVCLAFSGDGQRILSGSRDSTLKVWNAATGEVIRTLEGHEDAVICAAFSRDGRQIVSGSDDQTVKLWNVETGEKLLSLPGDIGSVKCVALSADGQRIVAGTGQSNIFIWDAATGSRQLTLRGHHSRIVTAVSFLGDGQRIVSGGDDGMIKIWEVATGRELRVLKGHTPSINTVCSTADGGHILSSAFYDRVARVWNLSEMGPETLSLKVPLLAVPSVAYSEDRDCFVTGAEGNGTVKVLDAATGATKLTLAGHVGGIPSVAASAGREHIVTGSSDKTVRTWDGTTGGLKRTLHGHAQPITSVAISADGQRIASGDYRGTLNIWDAQTAEPKLTLKAHAPVLGVAFSPNGQLVASAGIAAPNQPTELILWDAATGEPKLTLPGHAKNVTCVTFSADGKLVVAGGEDRTVRVWDAITGKPTFTLKGHADWITCVALSADGQRILSGSNDRTVRLWDAVTGEPKVALKSDTGPVRWVAMSHDGMRITSGAVQENNGWGSVVTVWEAAGSPN